MCDLLFPRTHPGFRNSFLARLHARGERVRTLKVNLMIANNFYGLSYFPPNLSAVTVFHATHAALAEAASRIVRFSTYWEWRLLWAEVSGGGSGGLHCRPWCKRIAGRWNTS